MTSSRNQPLLNEERGDEGGAALPLRLPPTKHFLFNRDLSQLEFFRRVLEEGLDEAQPLRSG